jgi:glycosyltransferase involved in cell wall biosynthesis
VKIAVVCWDLGHNAFGRAHLLADMLAADHDVQIVGSHFPKFGNEIWAPLRDCGIPVRAYPGGAFPTYFETMERMAAEIEADVVYAIKPRLPSLGVGLLAKQGGERGLVVDCDDLELSFVSASQALSLGDLMDRRGHPEFLRPEGRIWTAFSDWAVRFADAVTVASVPLAARYRGTVIPHARDERVFNPALYDRDEARARLGLAPHDRGVLFAGTPRRHKGIHRVAAALDRIGDSRNRLLVLATPQLREVMPLLVGLEQWVQPVPPPTLSDLPQLLCAADLVCLGQDPASEIAQWQMPAKITDALAMGVACLATPTPPLLPLIDEGALAPVEEEDLDSELERFLDDPALRAEHGERGRALFLRRFSYAAVRPRLERVMQRAASGGHDSSADVASALSFQRSAFGREAPGAPLRPLQASFVDEAGRVRAAVASALPPGAGPVAVVSRGDENLVRFDDRVGWHFPRNDDGVYAGYYPQDSDAAIRQLEDVRRRGARYLVIPDSSSWWLEHYVGFRDYLGSAHKLLEAGAGTAAIVELRTSDRSLPPPVDRGRLRAPGRSRPRRRRHVRTDAFDVVMFWKQHDTGLYGRRHDMLMQHLARSPRVGQVVQFDAPVDLASLLTPQADVPTHTALLRDRALARVNGIEYHPGLHQYSFVHGHDRRSAQSLPERDEYLLHIKEGLARHGIGDRPVVFWVYPNNFDFPEIAATFSPDLVVADVVDDHRTWLRPGDGKEQRILNHYEEIAALSDIVLVNCEPMRELMAPMAETVHLVPNAAEYPEPMAGAPLEAPYELGSLEGPVVGYAGNLSSRIDVELLDRLAAHRPDWNVVLMGSSHAGRSVVPLLRHPNVVFVGPRPYDEAKRFIRAFDVGLIPHLNDAMTRAMNPLKAFVYCALGVPVVSTDINNLGELRPLISVASDHDDFIAKVDAAISRGREPISAAADAILRRNSWDSRTRDITALVQAELTRVTAGR